MEEIKMANRALGKGLSALIPDKKENPIADSVKYINVDLVQYNKFQPRTNYDDTKLADLKASIKEKGVLQPILVRSSGDKYEVIAGERRLRAAKALNFKEVPSIIKEVSDQEALVIALVENIQREELNPIEEAEAYKRLIEEFQFTHDSVAQSVGKDRSTVSNLLRLLRLPDEIKQSVYAGSLSVGHARALLSVEPQTKQKKLFDKTLKKGLSVRELENLIKAQEKTQSQRDKNKIVKNSQIVELEDGLQKLLGTKVQIDSKKMGGKITIDFYSAQDLERIVKLIIK